MNLQYLTIIRKGQFTNLVDHLELQSLPPCCWMGYEVVTIQQARVELGYSEWLRRDKRRRDDEMESIGRVVGVGEHR